MANRVALVFALYAACSQPIELGRQCVRNSDCESPLVCVNERCRTECLSDRDCPLSAPCVERADGLGRLCVLPGDDAGPPRDAGRDSGAETRDAARDASSGDGGAPDGAAVDAFSADSAIDSGAPAADGGTGCGCAPPGLAMCTGGQCALAPIAIDMAMQTTASPDLGEALSVASYRTADAPFIAIATIEGPTRTPAVRSLELYASSPTSNRALTEYIGLRDYTERDADAGVLAVSGLEAIAVAPMRDGNVSNVAVAAIGEVGGLGRHVLTGWLLTGRPGEWFRALPSPAAAPPLSLSLLLSALPGVREFALYRNGASLSMLAVQGMTAPSTVVDPFAGSAIGASGSDGSWAVIATESELSMVHATPSLSRGSIAPRTDGSGTPSLAFLGGTIDERYLLAYADGASIRIRTFECDLVECRLDLSDAADRTIDTLAPGPVQHVRAVALPEGGSAITWVEPAASGSRIMVELLTPRSRARRGEVAARREPSSRYRRART